MYWNRLKHAGLYVFILWLTIANAIGQGFLVVDQASGTLDEIVTVATPLPDNQIAQSFTPLIPAVGFVQFSQNLPAFPGNDQVSFVVNLRQGAYNGPIISSTDPVVLVNHLTQISTFYFPASIQVSPGQLYFFEPVLQSTGFLDIGYKNPSSYLGGDAWNNGLQDTGDYWFREGIVVPEPDTVWLLLFGGSVFLWHRRIRRNPDGDIDPDDQHVSGRLAGPGDGHHHQQRPAGLHYGGFQS